MSSKNFYKFQVNEQGSQRINYAYLLRIYVVEFT